MSNAPLPLQPIEPQSMGLQLIQSQLIEISGPDAVAFAQAQFSSDVLALANGHWQWSAWLSAQGRVRAFFHLLRIDDENLRLLLRGGSAASLRDALARYVLRAKLTLRAIDDVHAYVIEQRFDGSDVALPVGTKIEPSRQDTCIALPGNTPRWLLLRHAGAPALASENSAAAFNRSALADIDAGIVTLDAALEDRLLPDWIGLGELGATSVHKGCYPGQEVVARLHFKGGNKRWLHRIEFDAAALPAPGTSLGAHGGDETQAHGLIVCSAWTGQGSGAALAVLSETDAGGISAFAAPEVLVRRAERVSPRLI